MWVKICGLNTVEQALLVKEARADAAGLNFFAKSPRSIPIELAARIVQQLAPDVLPIGLFVDAPIEDIQRTTTGCSIDTIQLHGNEPPRLLAELKPLRVIKAFRWEERIVERITQYLEEAAILNALPHALLIDAHVPGEFGGTGKTAPWDQIAQEYRSGWPPLILAGGLTPDNVAEAIHRVKPYGVDTASGVEFTPGLKDPEKIRAFIDRAKQSL